MAKLLFLFIQAYEKQNIKRKIYYKMVPKKAMAHPAKNKPLHSSVDRNIKYGNTKK